MADAIDYMRQQIEEQKARLEKEASKRARKYQKILEKADTAAKRAAAERNLLTLAKGMKMSDKLFARML